MSICIFTMISVYNHFENKWQNTIIAIKKDKLYFDLIIKFLETSYWVITMSPGIGDTNAS